MATITVTQLQAKKAAGEKFAVLTAYDAVFARLVSAAGVEAILVGDSVGMTLQGHSSTLPVTLSDMAYHIGAVGRGNTGALLIGDLPFGTYSTPAQTFESAALVMRAGAHMVKVEGGAWLAETVRQLCERGMPVCGHLGLTPQSVNAFGGFKVQGRSEEQAERIHSDARTLAEAGASLLVLECVPQALARAISKDLTIPVIGIGAGPGTDAQVLVLPDMLGLTPRAPKFVRNFMVGASSVQEAIAHYRQAVLSGAFPAPEHSYD